MNLTSVKREDSGWYQLQATNALGSATARVHVDVLYPPEIIKRSSVTVARRGEPVALRCRAEANPLTPAMFRWSRPAHRLVNVSTSYANSTSTLTVHSAGPDSAGDFECFVENKLGYDVARFSIVIEEAAHIVKSARLAKAAASPGETCHVTCRAVGAPDVSFSWSRHGDVISNEITADIGCRTISPQLDLSTWATVLEIRDVRASDYGAYSCTATNRLGSDTHTVQLVLPSVPDPPLDLRVLNVSSQAITLAWTPGFDGGFIQGFRFRYSESGSPQPTVQDGDPTSVRFTIGGLRPDTGYQFSVAGYSQLGVGRYTEPPLAVRTSGTPPVGYVTDREEPAELRAQGPGEGCTGPKPTQTQGSQSRGSISFRSSRSNSLEGYADKRDDRQLLPSEEADSAADSAHHATALAAAASQADSSDVIELSTRSALLPRSSGGGPRTVDGSSYGYQHLHTSDTFMDTLADLDHSVTATPDVISGDVTGIDAEFGRTERRHVQTQRRRPKLVSFNEPERPRPDSAPAGGDVLQGL
ncbi:nephrin-like [Pollicipes pollicipes]|uniref:nephrin-like n=1 Tax=Pollicipes pollicipes TaxID=41117 RepID=UPI001884B107|nr:nephrin-like [Pollicipes pollicipes]